MRTCCLDSPSPFPVPTCTWPRPSSCCRSRTGNASSCRARPERMFNLQFVVGPYWLNQPWIGHANILTTGRQLISDWWENMQWSDDRQASKWKWCHSVHVQCCKTIRKLLANSNYLWIIIRFIINFFFTDWPVRGPRGSCSCRRGRCRLARSPASEAPCKLGTRTMPAGSCSLKWQ